MTRSDLRSMLQCYAFASEARPVVPADDREDGNTEADE